MKFYEHEMRLFAATLDACAVWTGTKWKTLGVMMARKLITDGRMITEAEAKKTFPKADFETIPELI